MSKVTITRQQESELPVSVNVQFVNYGADYQQGSQQARRMAVRSVQKATVATPIVFTDVEAKNIAEKMLYNVWVERNRFSLKLSRKYAYLEPTDVITLIDLEGGFSYAVRILKRTESRNGAIEFECVADFSPVYIQSGVTNSAQVVTQVPVLIGATVAYILDLPALRDQDNSLGFYVALAGSTEVWGGGAVYSSIDGGATYAPVDSTSTPSVLGSALTALDDWTGANGFDETNSVQVQVTSGVLSSGTVLSVLNGNNLAALSSGTGWEVFQYRSAVLQEDGSYLLRGLLRGRFGTEWAMAGHAVDDKFVVLNPTTVRRVPITSALLNIPVLYKVLGVGQSFGSVLPTSITNRGVALKPYSPVILGGGSDGAGNVTLNWTRRTRVGGAWLDNSDVPLSEVAELYDVEIWSAGYTTLKRLIRVSNQNLVYLAADQVADFGSVQSTVYFEVFQISSIVGRGYGVKGSTEGVFGGYVTSSSVVPPPSGSNPAGRDVLQWPFAQDSIWNMPIGSEAVYVAANLQATFSSGDATADTWAPMPGIDDEIIILSPTSPSTAINYSSVGWTTGDRCAATGGLLVSAPIPDGFTVPDNGENGCAAILAEDGMTLVQVQPFTRCTAGESATALVSFDPLDIYGSGVTGAHGGSGLSAFGGSIRIGELRPGQTGMHHALKVNVYAKHALYNGATNADCYRWPAISSDSYASTWYGTEGGNTNTAMKMGALLAIPASVDIDTLGLETEPALQLAWTLQNYGAYIVDDTYGPAFTFSAEKGLDGSMHDQFAADWGFPLAQRLNDDTAWVRDIARLVVALYVVNNNTADSIGGGGTPLQPLAPLFA